jgi:hypothetical protein
MNVFCRYNGDEAAVAYDRLLENQESQQILLNYLQKTADDRIMSENGHTIP